MTIKVLIVDDHNLVREGITQLLQSEPSLTVVGSATSGREAIDRIQELLPEVVVMDIAMPVMNGIEATRQIKSVWPTIQVIALTMYDYDEYIREMFSAGAINYVLKTAAKQDLVAAIKGAFEGQTYLYPPVAAKIISQFARPAGKQEETSPEPLTQREKEISRYIAEGYSSQEIAGTLKLSTRTVQTHRANIMRKLGINNTAELVRYAIGAGLVKINS